MKTTMATFTVTIQEIMNDDYDADLSLIGLNDYPIFDNGYRPTLNEKIVGRFWLREIGFETDSVFRHYMRQRMREIMPYYNDIYRTTLIKFDMFSTVDIVSTGTDESQGQGKTDTESAAGSKSSSDSKSRSVASEFPQVQLSGNGDYATSAQDSVSNTTSDSESTGNDKTNTEQLQRSESENRTQGTQGSKSALLQEFRSTILNVDLMILDNLEDLFMQIWANGDDFTGRQRYGSPYIYQYPFAFGY